MLKMAFKNRTDLDNLVGMVVEVTNVSVKSYNSYNLIGLQGTIESVHTTCSYLIYATRVAIKIDGKYNKKSEKGLFWLKPADLKIVIKKEHNMENAKYCVVKDDSKNTTDIVAYYGEVVIGDLVICDYGYGNGKLSVRRVVDLILCEKRRCDGVIIGVADCSAYRKHCKYCEKKQELESAMEKAAKSVEKAIYYKYLSENDKDFAKIYKEYEELIKEAKE